MAKRFRCPRPVNRLVMMRNKGLSGPFAQNVGGGRCVKSVGNYYGPGGPGSGRVRLEFHAFQPAPNGEIHGILLGTGVISEARASSVFLPDHEGVYREFVAGEPAVRGGRVVRNEYDTSDLSNFTQTLVEVDSGIPDPVGGNTAYTVRATGSNGAIYQSPQIANEPGHEIVNSMWIRRRSGSGTIRIYKGESSSSDNVTAAITNEWQRIASDIGVTTGAGDRLGIRINTPGDEIDVWHVHAQNVSGASNQAPGEFVSSDEVYGLGVAGLRVFDYENGNTVTGNVVTEARGPDIPGDQWFYYTPDATNQVAYGRDLTDPSWTAPSMSVARDHPGIDGKPNHASTLTATIGNATCINQAVTAASAAHSAVFFVKRKTGTGGIDLSVDGGTTWQDVTSQVGADWSLIAVEQAAVANPQVGIRIRNGGDAVHVDAVGCYVDTLAERSETYPPVFTDGSAKSISRSRLTIPEANHSETDSAWSFEFGANIGGAFSNPSAGNPRLLSFFGGPPNCRLYIEAFSGAIRLHDGSNATSGGPLVTPSPGDNRVSFYYAGPEMGVRVNDWRARAFDGAMESNGDIEIVRAGEDIKRAFGLRNMTRHYVLDEEVAREFLDGLYP